MTSTRKFVFTIGSVLLAGLPVLRSHSSGAPLPDEVDRYVVREMEARQIPGVVVAVIDRGQVTVKRAYGLANLETSTPVRTDSVFELSSVTKPFTATAIMMLVEQNKVALDDPITRYIEAAPETWSDVRVRHLLTHTAGFPEHAFADRMDTSTQQQFHAVVQAAPLFRPGEKASYSDPGYVLLGMIIEKASGQRYADFLQKRIFDPLEMTSSHVLDQRRIVKWRVAPYSIREGKLERGRRDWQHELPSNYGIWSTVDDLVKFDAALTNGSLLKNSTLDLMWTPARLRNDEPVLVDGFPYGLGWFVVGSSDHRVVGHPGYSGTVLFRLVDDHLTVIVLTNLDSGSGKGHPYTLAAQIVRLVRPEAAAFVK